MNTNSKPLALFLAVAVATYPLKSHASLFGEENGALSTLVAQGVAEFAQVIETISQLKATYDETKKYVGMAEDAVNGFQEFASYADSIFKNPGDALSSVMPEAAFLQRELQSPESWGKGTGELQRLVRACLDGDGKCAEFKQAVSAKQARESISATFGTSPIQSDAIDAVDNEASYAIKGSMAANGKAALAGEQARALMKKCREGTTAEAMQACQSAANIGVLMQVEQTAALNEQVAESNRLKAVELAADNSELKKSAAQMQQRQKMLQAGSEGMRPVKLKFEGFDVGPVPNALGGAR